jgi:hypothetical protein
LATGFQNVGEEVIVCLCSQSSSLLAFQFHPDVNKQPGAEQKFKDISNAYEASISCQSCFHHTNLHCCISFQQLTLQTTSVIGTDEEQVAVIGTCLLVCDPPFVHLQVQERLFFS